LNPLMAAPWMLIILIWVMHRTATGWGEPRNLGAPVNSEESEYFPTLT